MKRLSFLLLGLSFLTQAFAVEVGDKVKYTWATTDGGSEVKKCEYLAEITQYDAFLDAYFLEESSRPKECLQHSSDWISSEEFLTTEEIDSILTNCGSENRKKIWVVNPYSDQRKQLEACRTELDNIKFMPVFFYDMQGSWMTDAYVSHVPIFGLGAVRNKHIPFALAEPNWEWSE